MKEIDFIRQYLLLQKMRFENRLTFYIDTDFIADNAVIPKLLIQPLVENCIVHAMENNPHILHICVTAYTYFIKPFGNCITITVYDNGSGFNVEELNHHVGLKNVQERLELFNPNSFFEIRSIPGKYTACNIIFFPEDNKM